MAADDDRPDPAIPRPGGLVGPDYLDSMLGYLTEAVYIFDRNGDLKARLSAPDGLLGYGIEAGSNVFTYMHPDDVPRGLRVGAEAQEGQAGWTGEMNVRLRHADGAWHRYRVCISNQFDNPAIGGMVARLSPEPAAADGLDDTTAEDLGSIADDLPTAYLALGQGARIRFASEAATQLLVSEREDLVGLPVSELVIDQDRPVVQAAYASLLSTTGARTVLATTRGRFGGRPVEAEFHTRGTDAEHKLITVVLVDHSDEPELVRLATHDALTGLANRTKVLQSITGLLLDPEPVLSVVYIDLDDLKGINDRFGHEAGDRALVAVAQRLQELVRPGDIVGRMSGDEFVIVCPGLDGTALMHFVERVGGSTWDPTTAPFGELPGEQATGDAGGERRSISISAGGATAVAGDTTTSLLSRADEAMYAAKHRIT